MGLKLHGPGGADGPESFGTDRMFDFAAQLIDEIVIDFLHQSAGPDADIGIVFIEDGEELLKIEVSEFGASGIADLGERAVESFDEHFESLGDFADA